jgi:hypothetical protein
MTYIEAAIEILRQNNNNPMSSRDIWEQISNQNLVKTDGKTPKATLNAIMIEKSSNSNFKSKAKKPYFMIVSKNPMKFIILENEVINVDFDLSDEEIIDNFDKIKLATSDIKSCIDDINHLCDALNDIDRNYLYKYYNSDKTGVVIDLRKEVAKELLPGKITPNKLESVIRNHKSANAQSLKSWANPYKILHPFINYKYQPLDIFIEKFIKFIISKIGDVNYTISNFNGSQHQGSDHYWIAIFNKNHKSQSEGLQLFFSFKDGIFTCGIYNYLEDKHVSKFVFDGDLNRLYDFINVNAEIILNDLESLSVNLLKRVNEYIEKNQNQFVTLQDIITTIEINISESALRKILEESDNFESQDDKWRIKDQIPGTSKVKQYFIEQGFITIDMLNEVLKKHGIETIDI